jgi:plasmid stabilization system protein ParE
VKRDSTAIVVCTFADDKVRLVWHRIFQPSPDDPLDFEATVEQTLLDLQQRFYVREIRFDPYQLVAVAQRLTAAGLPMVEFPQSVRNLTESSTNLYEIIKGRNLVAYADDDIRVAVSRAVALETSRGWRIAKEKASHKIDCHRGAGDGCTGSGPARAGIPVIQLYRGAARHAPTYGLRSRPQARRQSRQM